MSFQHGGLCAEAKSVIAPAHGEHGDSGSTDSTKPALRNHALERRPGGSMRPALQVRASRGSSAFLLLEFETP